MKIIEVTDRTPDLIGQLLDVWEASVRATHLFLADGEISRVQLTRALSVLRSKGILETKRHRIRIADPSALAALCSSEALSE